MTIQKLVLFEIIKNMEKSNFRFYIKTHFELGDSPIDIYRDLIL